jgi:hypothetical protein
MAAASIFVMMAGSALRADLAPARAEPNLERRARLALENAAAQLHAAYGAYAADNWDKANAALDEMRDSVDLAYASLKATGKAPRNSSQFKNLEIKTNTLLKGLRDFLQKMAYEDREQAAPIEAHVQQVHDEVLESVMASPKRMGHR